MKQPEPLKSFYPQLAQDSEVQEQLARHFTERAPVILQQMEAGSELAMTPLSLAIWDGGFQD
jgi:hypothetical protein